MALGGLVSVLKPLTIALDITPVPTKPNVLLPMPSIVRRDISALRMLVEQLLAAQRLAARPPRPESSISAPPPLERCRNCGTPFLVGGSWSICPPGVTPLEPALFCRMCGASRYPQPTPSSAIAVVQSAAVTPKEPQKRVSRPSDNIDVRIDRDKGTYVVIWGALHAERPHAATAFRQPQPQAAPAGPIASSSSSKAFLSNS